MRTLKALSLFAVFSSLIMIHTSSSAQSPETKGLICNHPDACAKKGCKGPCVDVWEERICKGGYCPQGFVASSAKKLDLQLYNVSPAQEQKIRELLDKGD